MFRHVLRNFQRILTLQSAPCAITATAIKTIHLPGARRVSLFRIENSPGVIKKTGANDDDDDLDADIFANRSYGMTDPESEYIVPYRAEDERGQPMKPLIAALRTRYHLNSVEVKRLFTDQTVKRAYRMRPLVNTMELLCMEGITKSNFLENPWLLTLNSKRLREKLLLLRTVPKRDINHFAPFLRLTLPRLRKVVHIMQSEAEIVPHGNRVYYISEMLQTDPHYVTKYLSKRLFVMEMPFVMLEQNLHHMLHYEVSPQNILKDLWAFRYTPKSVELRLERAKRAKKAKIMPWMVRCTEPILQRSLKLSLDELAVLGDKKTVLEYVAARLQFDLTTTKAIMTRHSPVSRVRVTKIKDVLDYLLDEAGFTRYQIANVPRILCHSLETTKQRILELESYGCRPSSLIIVCRSKREYDKFVKSWLQTDMKKNKQPEQSETKEQLDT